jgi:hypothetical protein
MGMDHQAINTLLAIVCALFAGVAAVVAFMRRLSRTEGQWEERFVKIESIQEVFRKDHVAHYRTTTDQGQQIASLQQRASDHQTRDDQQFAMMLSMFEEIRKDIKELLREIGK